MRRMHRGMQMCSARGAVSAHPRRVFVGTYVGRRQRLGRTGPGAHRRDAAASQQRTSAQKRPLSAPARHRSPLRIALPRQICDAQGRARADDTDHGRGLSRIICDTPHAAITASPVQSKRRLAGLQAAAQCSCRVESSCWAVACPHGYTPALAFWSHGSHGVLCLLLPASSSAA